MPLDVLEKCFSDLYVIQSAIVDPTTAGYPVRRKRRWTIMVHKKILPYLKAVVTHGGRTMSIHLHGAPDIIILNTYCCSEWI